MVVGGAQLDVTVRREKDSGLNQQSSTKTAFWREGPGVAGEW